jgi:hypothetical protein
VLRLTFRARAIFSACASESAGNVRVVRLFFVAPGLRCLRIMMHISINIDANVHQYKAECAGITTTNDFHLAFGSAPYDGIMLWKKDGSSFEIRTQGELPDGRPALDEIVADGASIHLEQISHDQWWMGIEAGGKYFHLNLGLRDGQLQVHLSDQGEEYADWEGDSRERPFPEIES